MDRIYESPTLWDEPLKYLVKDGKDASEKYNDVDKTCDFTSLRFPESRRRL